jgi:hypothetical protein
LFLAPRGGETNMSSEMSNMMGNSSISRMFAIIILVISVLLVLHIVFTLWRQRSQLHQLIEQHNRFVHSLPMSLGMISTVTICSTVGALMNTYISASYIVGLFIGIVVSGMIGLTFKDAIAIIDGVVSGVMGGLMGVMMAYMIPEMGLFTVVVLLTILFVVTWIVMCRRIIAISSKKSQQKGVQNRDLLISKDKKGIFTGRTAGKGLTEVLKMYNGGKSIRYIRYVLKRRHGLLK